MYQVETVCGEMIQRLKTLCEKKGISYYALAKKSKIAPSTAYSIMTGSTMPRIPTLLDICNTLDVSAGELLDDQKSLMPEKTDPIELTGEEKDIINRYRILSDEKKRCMQLYLDMLEQYSRDGELSK